ncbi:heme-copper oxidase subunit III [Rothia sp. (in: high G+C Gram-positive bacteria)]|uniref:aa3-type cytochrome oxidase subunit III n=1 Tax=Rothia sp. (in: high G+C Gram-positive bacteria) TaxID=1885016 RepID=UPI000EC19BE6|nr:cytochrome B [Rothia sp. (in: high G+C Gram-positive bacteria)]
MTTATHTPSKSAHAALNRPNQVAVGTVVWLASELMFFAGLFAMYFTLRASRPDIWAENTPLLEVPLALANTIVLVLSSVTCQFGVFKAEQLKPRRTGSIFDIRQWGMVEWFLLTFIMGAFFVSLQAYEYANLVAEGMTIASSAYGSAFYITTGFHALHVTGGLIAFLLIIGRAYMAKRFGHYEATSAIVVSYYWHFVDVIWIVLFLVVYFLK